jgi:nitrite reductase/ring-hydroxylating ferredoxin subunit
MERRDFISKLGIGAATALTFGCLHGYSMENYTENTTLSNDKLVDFSVDLTDPSNASLQTNGGFVIANDIVVARTKSGEFVAATVICSHKNNKKVRYIAKENEWQCSVHGARFGLDGQGLNKKGFRGLQTYNTELVDENTLRVFE